MSTKWSASSRKVTASMRRGAKEAEFCSYRAARSGTTVDDSILRENQEKPCHGARSGTTAKDRGWMALNPIRGCANGSRFCGRRPTWPNLVLALLVCCLATYGYSWRHYLAIVFAPPSRYNYRKHYNSRYAAANASLITSRRRELTQPLPDWIKAYVDWHARVRTSEGGLSGSTPILLLSLGEHKSDGGLADRLRSLPYLLWEAIRTKRFILMQWKAPCAIEEFLLPPLGGIDWTVPENSDFSNATWYDYDEQHNRPLADNEGFQSLAVVKVRHKPWTFAEGIQLLVGELNVTSRNDPLFAHIFRLLLTPSPPVQKELDATTQRLGLVPYAFDAIHLRARYPTASDAFQPKRFSRGIDADGFKWTPEARKEVLRLVGRAIDCLPEESPNITSSLPIYFASDTNEAVRLVSQADENTVGLITPYERLHFNRNDRIGAIRKTPPSAFYPALVDLLLLSQARCLVIGDGGYGLLASSLSLSNCLWYHQRNRFFVHTGDEGRLCNGVD